MTRITEQSASAQEHVESDAKAAFGFWLYIMTDCVLFASLFATYAVLHNNTFGGPGADKLFDLPYALAETLILLTSSFTCGLALLAVQRRKARRVVWWFQCTLLLGVAFLALELHEFLNLAGGGNGPSRSGFLSAFFTLVGTHGLHITCGLIWMIVLMAQIARRGLAPGVVRRLTLLTLFWHFLDIVWIFIFTIVYLQGAL